MTWGKGPGPWGDGTIEETGQALAPVAGEPITFDFSDEPDGPLPGLWETYVLDTDAVDDVAVAAEAAPGSYYSVQGGLGFWQYSKVPVAPPPATPFAERGVAASPSGTLEGRNARAAVIAASPVGLLDESQDEFFYEITLGLRFNSGTYSWVGGRMRARWAAGVWVEPLAVEAVQAVGQAATVLAAATIEPLPDPVDFWRVHSQVELEVVVREDEVLVNVGGIWQALATFSASGPAQVVLDVRVYHLTAGVITPLPAIAALQLQSLRDLEKLGPPPQLPGDHDLEGIGVLPTLRAPLGELLEQGYLKRVGARRFEALLDFQAEVDEQRWFIRAGELLHAREPWVGQQFVPVTRDLKHERDRGLL
jgi:hypothetical protein